MIVQLTEPVFTLFEHSFSWRDLILIAGGLFLVWKATKQIHHNVDPDHGPDVFEPERATTSFAHATGGRRLMGPERLWFRPGVRWA